MSRQQREPPATAPRPRRLLEGPEGRAPTPGVPAPPGAPSRGDSSRPGARKHPLPPRTGRRGVPGQAGATECPPAPSPSGGLTPWAGRRRGFPSGHRRSPHSGRGGRPPLRSRGQRLRRRPVGGASIRGCSRARHLLHGEPRGPGARDKLQSRQPPARTGDRAKRKRRTWARPNDARGGTRRLSAARRRPRPHPRAVVSTSGFFTRP